MNPTALNTLRKKVDRALAAQAEGSGFEGSQPYGDCEPSNPQTENNEFAISGFQGSQSHRVVGTANPQKPQADPEATDWMPIEEAFQHPELLLPPERLSWLAWRGRSSLLIGNPKAGKSTVASADAMRAVDHGLKVLYVSIDEAEADVVRRFKGYTNSISLHGNLSILRPGTNLTEWAQLDVMVKAVKADIIYLDSWDKIVGKLEDDVPEGWKMGAWRTITDKLNDLARQNSCGVVMFIHTKKSDETVYAGSGQIAAAVDMTIVMTSAGDDLRRLEFAGRYIVPEMLVEWNSPKRGGDGSCSAVDAAEKNLTDDEEDVLRFLAATPATKKLILASKDLKPQKLDRIITDFKKRGWIDGAITGQGQNQSWTYNINAKGQNELDIFDGKVPSPSTNPIHVLLGG